MKLRFESLVLEITRRCNMTCAHCMRGEAQDVDISDEVIEELFKNTGYIKRLVLTGGEPSLAPDIIDSIVYFSKKYECEIGSFFCATNAKEYSLVFQTALCRLAEYCENKEKCVLTVTIDQFHEKPSWEAVHQYHSIPFYKAVGEKWMLSESEIIDRGNANKNSIGFFDINTPEYLFGISENQDSIVVKDRLYINVFGDVLLDVDLSYEGQRHHAIGDILKKDINDILLDNRYIVPKQPEGYVCKLILHADENTMSENEFTDSHHSNELAEAIFNFQLLVSNLPMMPKAQKPYAVSVKTDTALYQNISPEKSIAAKAVFSYYDASDNFLGNVTATVEIIKSEDADG